MELRLETFGLYHPDTLSSFLQGKIAGLKVNLTPPGFSDLLSISSAKFVKTNVKSFPIKHFLSSEAESVFKAVPEGNLSNSVLLKQLVESNLRKYVLDSLNEGQLKQINSSSTFNTSGVFKTVLIGKLMIVCRVDV